MDELTLFAELRPDDRLAPADLHDLRGELFSGIEPVASTSAQPDIDNAIVMPVTVTTESGYPGRSRGLRLAVAAAAVAVVGLGGVWAVADRSDGGATTAPAAQPPAQGEPATSLSDEPTGYGVPLIGFAEPGWTVVGAFDDTAPHHRAAVWMSGAGIDGPWVEIKATATESETTWGSVPPGGGATDIGGQQADVTEIEDGVIVRWTDITGTQIEAFGWNMTLDDTVAIAERAAVTATGITIAELPPGAVLADPAVTEALGRHASYRFAHTDGREVEITLTPGGPRGLYQRQGPTDQFQLEGRTPITIGDEPATIIDWTDNAADPPAGTDTATGLDAESPGGEYRVDIQRGFWTWEFNTTRFGSQQQVVDLVAGSTVVDAGTWNASLADTVVAPDDRAATIDELLVDVALPPGFDTTQLASGATDDRYQLIAEVSAAVVCAWYDEWATDDPTRRNEAAAVLGSARDWDMLTEIADQGGWSDAIWGYTDALTGIDSPVESAPEHIDDALSCNRFD